MKFVHIHSISVVVKAFLLLLAALLLASLPSCTNYLKLGNELYGLGEYYDAGKCYKRAYSKVPAKDRTERARVAFLAGECFRHTNASAKALASYVNAVRYAYPDSMLYLYLGQQQLKEGKYRDAEQSFQTFLERVPNHPLAKNGLRSAQQAALMKQELPRFEVRRSTILNSQRSEYSPSYSRTDSDQVYLTSNRDKAKGETLNGITGMKSADLFLAKKNERKQWQQPEAIESEINSEYEDGACSFSPDGQTMYFTRCREAATAPVYAEIWSSQRSGATWGAPTKCQIVRDSLSSVAHPAVSVDGAWLYFVSDMPGGVGGKDLWRCPIAGAEFGAVENLGPSINTLGDEMFPYVREDGSLYFASNGWPGMGGLDVFRAVRDSLTGSYRISNLGYPLNSSADDFGITFEPAHNRGFFSSNRGDGRGSDHIFEFVGDELDYQVTGWVYDKDGDPLPAASITIIGDDGTNRKVNVNGDGFFSQKVERNTRYVFLANCRGFLNARQELATDTTVEKKTYELDFPMSSILRPVLIENIFYEFDSAKLTPASSASLDKLIALLNNNPTITIELGAHCDYIGNDTYNLHLSQRRAESVVRYLTAGGIKPDRLTAQGYGESVPKKVTRRIATAHPFLKEGDILTEAFIKMLKPAEQEICNSLNRRTEFTVIHLTHDLPTEEGQTDAPKEDTSKKKPVEAGDFIEE